jgi:hypothetical protein
LYEPVSLRAAIATSCDTVSSKTITLVFAASPVSMQHLEVRIKTGWLGFMIICLSGAICCISELAL